ncbi:unnamed protein product [Aureobasidium pullulans]|nr:unnamed protein product [Aureobasidium pullulans]
MGSISATINGNAIVLPVGSEEEKWCKLQHLENNTFEREETSQNVLSATPSNAEDEEASRQSFLEDEDIRVVVVRIREGRIADWKGGVKDWVLAPAEGADPFAEADEDTGEIKQSNQSSYIHIRIQLQGLPKKFDQKKILKVIKKAFACNGTIVSDTEMGEVIQLQGDQRKDVQEFLCDKKEGLGLDAKTIKVHGF